MSRFRKLSHSIWYCQYHILWTPKYRYKVLQGQIKTELDCCLRLVSRQLGCDITELNIQIDHVHLLLMIPPKLSISKVVGTLKGKSAIRIINKFKKIKKDIYWGGHFWSRGYCVDTVGLDPDKIRMYVRYQQDRDKDK